MKRDLRPATPRAVGTARRTLVVLVVGTLAVGSLAGCSCAGETVAPDDATFADARDAAGGDTTMRDASVLDTPDAGAPADAVDQDAPTELDGAALDAPEAFDAPAELDAPTFDATAALDAPTFDVLLTPDAPSFDAPPPPDAPPLDAPAPADAPSVPDAPVCSGEETTTWSGAALDAVLAVRTGTRFDAGAITLETELATTYPVAPVPDMVSARSVCAGDFDLDGWTDLAVATAPTGRLVVLRNTTFDSPEPDWNDPEAFREPRFTMVSVLRAGAAAAGLTIVRVACGNFTTDDSPEIVFVAGTATGTTVADVFVSRRDGTFAVATSAVGGAVATSDLGPLSIYGGTDFAAVDVDHDGRLELVVGVRTTPNRIWVLTNGSAVGSPPRFTSRRLLVGTTSGSPDFGTNGPDAFALGDVTGDGIDDLVVAGTSQSPVATQRLQLFPGTAPGVLSATAVSAGIFPGGGSVVVMTELTGDAASDLVVLTNNWNYNLGNGGNGFLYTGTAPYASVPEVFVSRGSPLPDVDYGVVLDYDHDPFATSDFFLGDGAFPDGSFVAVQRRRMAPLASGTAATGSVAPALLPGAVLEGASLSWAGAGAGTVRFDVAVDGGPWLDCGDGSTCPALPGGTSLAWRVRLAADLLRTDAPRVTAITLRQRWRRCGP